MLSAVRQVMILDPNFCGWQHIKTMNCSEVRRVALLLSRKCINNCIMCISGRMPTGVDLSEENIKKCLIQCLKKGATELEVSGFEPLARSDAVSIISFAIQNGYNSVQVLTNARPLARPGLAEALVESEVSKFTISCHSANEEEEFSISRRREAFAENRKGIARLLEAVAKAGKSLSIATRTVILRQNVSSLESIARQLVDMGIERLEFTLAQSTAEDLSLYRKFAVHCREVVARLIPALEACLEAGKKVMVSNIPYCFFSGHEDLWPLLRPAEQQRVTSPRLTPTVPRLDKKFLDKLRLPEKKKLAVCKRCAKFDQCPGMPASYLGLFATSPGIKAIS